MTLALTRARRTAALACAALALAACSRASASGTVVEGPGPLDVGPPVASVQVAKPGTEVGWGMLLLRAPAGEEITLLSAKAITTDPAAAIGSGYAAGWPRSQGQIQWTSWPPTPAEVGATPTELPELRVDVPGENGGSGTEVFVGLKVPAAGVEMTGIEITYTDGTTTWTQVVGHAVKVCTSGGIDDCPIPALPKG